MISVFKKIFMFAISGFLLTSVVILSILWSFSNKLPDYKFLKNYKPPVSSKVYSGDGKLVSDFSSEKRIFVPFEAIPEKLDLDSILNVSDFIITSYLSGEYAEICIIAPHYVNSFTTYPVVKTLLPFSNEMVKDHVGHMEIEFAKKKADFTIFEPSQEEFIDSLFENLIKSLFIQDFLQLKAAEYSSRMIAMKNATDSASKIVDEKTLIMNKARQAAITQEIAELAGAKAAMEN